ncbi:MAG TPA: tRNA lysidine(34) synthetase TilS [Bradyrhizobium sp.]|nr:tRNA lysidine(34) synthetase TilS [Bradyrhizobium sp.]
MRDDDNTPISAQDAKRLFADFRAVPAIVLAVSGGPDSVALMWLMARWRRTLARGPRLVAVTVDHGLRAEAAREARDVKLLARTLDLPHRTMRWSGDKPKTGLPAAARAARYRLLAQAARAAGATHILTAHTRDDQAETLLMRLLRGSGIAGLAAMARESARDGVVLARPLLNVPKSRLVATLNKAKVAFADDPTNRDTALTRPRLRTLLPLLAAEGGDARGLARLASRLARANAAVEVLADGAERYLALKDRTKRGGPDARDFDAAAFAAMPEEVRLRLLLRAINRFGHEGPAELGKVEALLVQLDRSFPEKTGKGRSEKGRSKGARIGIRQTLAGALVSLSKGRIRIEPAPVRRGRTGAVSGRTKSRLRDENA